MTHSAKSKDAQILLVDNPELEYNWEQHLASVCSEIDRICFNHPARQPVGLHRSMLKIEFGHVRKMEKEHVGYVQELRIDQA